MPDSAECYCRVLHNLYTFLHKRAVRFFSVKEKKDILLCGVDDPDPDCIGMLSCRFIFDETLIVRRQLLVGTSPPIVQPL
ncbi:MAG: hypothetical protein ABI855_10680 [Bacteroidota bacterium]